MSVNRVYAMMVLAAFFWSGAFITGKLAVREFPPFALTFFRFFFALPLIFVILYKHQPDKWLPHKNEWPPLIMLGLIGTFLYHALFFTSLQYTTAINSSLIGSTNPMITAVLAAMFIKEKISLVRMAGIMLSLLGVILTVTNGQWSVLTALSLNYGDILMLLAVGSWACYSLLSRKVMQKYKLSPILLTAYTFLTCTVISIPFVLWENPATYLPTVTFGGWLSILYMTIFASVIGYLVHLIAIEKIGAAKSAIFINLVPVFTIIQSVYILGEPFSLLKLLSAAIIISGVYLTTRPDAEKTENLPTVLGKSDSK
ncbi:DMT family transporter [Dendrosporobacter sp. 1207_IL3150]|uniref:DMT family transporter n=1 Tax=Dendrosporobacter sp. 1207_IL3150 TaxID=3084054 RepID=UPI002FD889BF